MKRSTEYVDLLAEYSPQPIHSTSAYHRALAQVEQLMVPRPSAAERLLIELLATLVEKYESRELPLPEVRPAQMRRHLLDAKGAKPAEVAKATGIPPATISNVLAHRRGISKKNAVLLGKYFGVSPSVFLDGTASAPERKSASQKTLATR
jgi:HTH-type transcriptional regulator/antitoxin HigA